MKHVATKFLMLLLLLFSSAPQVAAESGWVITTRLAGQAFGYSTNYMFAEKNGGWLLYQDPKYDSAGNLMYSSTTIAKQLLRSATSIGANINEAVYGNSKADFISKLHISLKETGESIYWITLLKRTDLIEYNFNELLSLAEEIKRMLIASLNTAKENAK